MGERNTGVRSILRRPEAYCWIRDALGLNRWLRRYVEEFIKPTPGDRILDVGCGTGEVTRYLSGATYVGVDRHRPYIDFAIEKFGNRGQFFCADVADHIEAFQGEFDLILANGLLHHLDNSLAEHLFSVGAQILSEKGRMITVDPCRYEGQARITRFIINNDRGKNVRQLDEYAPLAKHSFSDVTSRLWYGFVPIPFSVAIVECKKPLAVSSSVKHSQ